jgi:hypothetical protein
VVGASAAGYPQARPEQPSLEDGYMWLMKSSPVQDPEAVH